VTDEQARPAPQASGEWRFEQPEAEVALLAHRHTMAVQAWLTTRSPQAGRFDGIGVRAGSSGLPVPLLNLALDSDFPPESSDETIASEIQAVKAFFAARGVPWSWWLSPFASPADMGQRLRQHGLTTDRPPLPAMVAPLPSEAFIPDPVIDVYRAETLADLHAASTIRRLAFAFPEGAALDYFEAMPADWLADESPARLYLARIKDGPPAAIGALIMGLDVPGVYVMATLPGWGRQGLGKAILHRILGQASADGHHLVILTASRYGEPLYRQFGFETLFGYEIFKEKTG
jgi:GNAT superfamily N-acetyltransferase